MLQQLLSKILELPFPHDEARLKLIGTYMEVNEELKYIYDICEGTLFVGGIEDVVVTPVNDITSLSIFLPESGVYKTEKGDYILIERQPLRQWKKSYQATLYKRNILHVEGPINTETYLASLLFNAKRYEMFILKDRLHYMDKPIGKVKDGVIFITDNNYYQEALDWNKEGKWQILM